MVADRHRIVFPAVKFRSRSLAVGPNFYIGARCPNDSGNGPGADRAALGNSVRTASLDNHAE